MVVAAARGHESVRIILDGQSYNNYPQTPVGVDLRTVLRNALALPVSNASVNGYSWVFLNTTQDTRQYAHFVADQNILVMNGGQGDLVSTAPAYTAQQCYDNTAAYALDAKANGADHIIFVTVMMATYFYPQPSAYETKRLDYNNLCRADASNAFDDICDVAVDSRLLTAEPVYCDTVHPTAAGVVVYAELLAPKILSAMTQAPPLQISGLVHWLDASTLGLSNGTPVDSFTDKSSGGRNATAAGSARPTYVTGFQNGLGAVSFDGTDDVMQTASVPTAVTDNFTMIVVAKAASISSVCLPYFNGNGGSNGWGVGPVSGSGDLTKVAGLVGGLGWHAAQSSFSSSDTRLLMYRRASSAYTIYDSGFSVLNPVGTPSPNAPSPSLIVGGHTTADINLAPCHFMEGLIYDRALTNAELNTLGTYLVAKWGLTWTAIP